MNFYVNLPTKENMNSFHERCAKFEAGILFEYIKSLEICNNEKKQILESALEHFKTNPR